MSRRILQSLPIVALATALAVTGYWLIFTAFMVYDDEGYVLWSLRSYSATGGLYVDVFSQYGPFFYVYYDALHRFLGFPFENDAGRLLTLGYWLATALAGGVLTWVLTRSRVAALAATALTFTGLVAMIREPIHPGGLITLLAMAGAATGAFALLRERTGLFAVAVGATGAALALIKINVGAFFLIAAGSWMAASTRPSRALGWLIALGCVLSPWLLMRSLWPAPWVTHYALIFACSALALAPGLMGAARAEHDVRSWRSFFIAAVGLGLVTLGLVTARGTSLAALWHGMVVAPLSHPGVYFFPVAWLPGSGVLALFSLGAALLIQRTTFPANLGTVIAGLRIATGLWFLSGAFQAENEGMTRFALSYGPSLAWLMAIPLTGSRDSGPARARLWLAWVFVWQTLHAFPVAGSQIAWGTFLWATLLVTGLAEALTFFSDKWRIWRGVGLAVVLAGGLMAAGRLAFIGREFYLQSRPLGLPGAEQLRPPADLRRQLAVLVENLRMHCNTLFSLPGLFSLNIWSDRPTPTGANVTHWFSLLSAAEQEAIIARLEADPRAGLVVHRYLLDFLRDGGFPAQGRLRAYLDASFERVLTVGFYELHLHRGRSIAPLSTVRLLPTGANGAAELELVMAPIEGRRIASVALRPLHATDATVARIEPTPGKPWQLVPLQLDGAVAGPPTLATQAFALQGISRVSIPVTVADGWSRTGDTCVILLDASGAEIAAATFAR